jgi:hypothetical protein
MYICAIILEIITNALDLHYTITYLSRVGTDTGADTNV